MICEKNCVWKLTWHVSMLGPELDGTWDVPNKLHSNFIFAAHFFFSACCRYLRISTFSQHEMCSYSPSNWHCEDTNASPRLLTLLCSSSNPYSAAPIILNGTETSRHCTETVCVRLSFHHRWPATFQRVAKHHEQGKQATHLAGGEEEGEGTSEDAHGWVLCGVQNFNNEGRGRKQGRR